MPSLRSNQKYKETRAQLVPLNHLKRHLDKLIEAFQIPDSAVLLSALQKRIHRLESVIEEYEDCKSGSWIRGSARSVGKDAFCHR